MAAPVTMRLFDDLVPTPLPKHSPTVSSPRQPLAPALQSAGTCRFCGCHGDSCTGDASGDKCVFVDPERTICSRPSCVSNYRPKPAAKPAVKVVPIVKRPCGCAVCSGRARGRCRQYFR